MKTIDYTRFGRKEERIQHLDHYPFRDLKEIQEFHAELMQYMQEDRSPLRFERIYDANAIGFSDLPFDPIPRTEPVIMSTWESNDAFGLRLTLKRRLDSSPIFFLGGFLWRKGLHTFEDPERTDRELVTIGTPFSGNPAEKKALQEILRPTLS